MLRLHTAFTEEQMALAERRPGQVAAAAAAPGPDPVAEARAFLAARRNFFPVLDDSAALLACGGADLSILQARLKDRHGLDVRYADRALLGGTVRWHNYHHRRIELSEMLDHAGRRFQIALQLAILEQEEAISAELARGRLTSADAETLVRRALQSYWAAALLMPYAAFAKASVETRYDVEVLAARFGVSFEQAAHRLTTLQKPGAAGVPFFFLRVDQAGNVSKRLDGAGFPFARHGGGCPLWNVHRVFSKPWQVDVQLFELTGGERFVSISRTVRDAHASKGRQVAVRAVALTFSAKHLDRVVYGDRLKDTEPERIGVSCYICHLPRCGARSAPPIGREILPIRFRDSGVPFAFSGE
jgi:predicted transcriptional regulator